MCRTACGFIFLIVNILSVDSSLVNLKGTQTGDFNGIGNGMKSAAEKTGDA